MNDASTSDVRHVPVALAIAGAATVLTLGLRVEGGDIGRTNPVRVLIVAAIALIALAAVSASPSRSRHLSLGAIVMLGVTIALIVGDAAPQVLIVLLIAVGALVWARKQPAGS